MRENLFLKFRNVQLLGASPLTSWPEAPDPVLPQRWGRYPLVLIHAHRLKPWIRPWKCVPSRYSIHTFAYIWPWPLTSDFENIFSNSHSRDEFACGKFHWNFPLSTEMSLHAKYVLTDSEWSAGRGTRTERPWCFTDLASDVQLPVGVKLTVVDKRRQCSYGRLKYGAETCVECFPIWAGMGLEFDGLETARLEINRPNEDISQDILFAVNQITPVEVNHQTCSRSWITCRESL